MAWTRADALKVGMYTSGGLKVSDISCRHGLFFVAWTKNGKTWDTIPYHADQEFDIADTTQHSPTKEDATMAQKVNIVVESDLSGQPDAKTVTFALDGTGYEIDLTDKEASKFRADLAPYVGKARVTGKPRKRGSTKPTAAADGASPKAVREWAQANGHEVPARGRIPAEVQQAYEAAHPAA